ncbi:M20/M25/M40 family metallo-hydrolase [Bacillus horti]|uniref:Arginine utilization protein RocB n=1 Tax=Caldalkalibacillus horti TaxID=77523 RepID=A0ABT9W4E0_9BACI|nr:M20/M25/M40 family metallo-hydrolase [Bacillus horti]MDQ0167944.1 arginine utilization protein RocB [Bacillus horti]
MKWATKDQKMNLLQELVRIPSVSGSEAEKQFSHILADKLRGLSYFQEVEEHLNIHETGDGRSFVTALVKSKKETRKTVVLLSHFDVVEVECYGELEEHAFDIEKLTTLIYSKKDMLPDEVKSDLELGEWWFGRGVMDMKCGLAIHVSLIEQASKGEFEGNLLLLTVPDEEVNSVGMRAAVPALVALAEEHELEYELLINSEPMDLRTSGDRNHYLEMGSVGKALPAFFCYGKETHAKEPLNGLNGNYMASVVTCEMELEDSFSEPLESELTPPPTNLIQNDLLKEYSVTIPYRAVTMFNLFLVEKTVEEYVEPLLGVAKRSAKIIEQRHAGKVRRYGLSEGIAEVKVRVFQYEELYRYACETYTKERVDQLIEQEWKKADSFMEDRQLATMLVDVLALLCKDLAPMIVFFFAPPYYPSISSHKNSFLQDICTKLSDYTETTYGFSLLHQNYHSAMMDLSYVGSATMSKSNKILTKNMPLWEKGYTIPFEAMEKFSIPVLNLGPYGFDPHKWTERLELTYSFEVLPDLLTKCLHQVFQKS